MLVEPIQDFSRLSRPHTETAFCGRTRSRRFRTFKTLTETAFCGRTHSRLFPFKIFQNFQDPVWRLTFVDRTHSRLFKTHDPIYGNCFLWQNPFKTVQNHIRRLPFVGRTPTYLCTKHGEMCTSSLLLVELQHLLQGKLSTHVTVHDKEGFRTAAEDLVTEVIHSPSGS